MTRRSLTNAINSRESHERLAAFYLEDHRRLVRLGWAGAETSALRLAMRHAYAARKLGHAISGYLASNWQRIAGVAA